MRKRDNVKALIEMCKEQLSESQMSIVWSLVDEYEERLSMLERSRAALKGYYEKRLKEIPNDPRLP